MQGRNGAVAAVLAGLAFSVAVTVRAQTPPTQAPATQAPQQQTPPVQTPPAGEHGGEAPPPRPQGQGQGQGRGGDQARFPAHQRPPADPAVVARGKALFAGSCAACHGADARGGQLGGVNLLRSQLVLNDRDSELILPIVQNGRPGTQMPPIPLPVDDVKAITAFLHDLQSKGSNQGGPPPGEEAVLNVLVGDPKAGADYFAATCSKCHNATGDLKGIATRIPDAKVLQNVWVSGGAARMRGPGAPSSRPVVTTASITLASGEKVEGRLVRVDDFLITVAKDDGTQRTFARQSETDPKVEIADPLEGHRRLLSTYTDKNMHDVTAYLATLK